MPRELQPSHSELDDWKQAARVEAGLRREFLARAEKAEAALERLRSAAQDVIDRWETPAWKDAAPTAGVINCLKSAVKNGDQS